LKKIVFPFLLLIAIPIVLLSFFSNQKKDVSNEKNLIEQIFKNYSTEYDYVFANPEKYTLQIIYTQINRDSNNVPSFTEHYYNVNSQNYFYAASMVKLPCSALALEKINELNVSGLTKSSIMFTDSAYKCQKKVTKDNSSFNKKPSLENYIKKMLLVSDNDAYSRVYEFLGQDYIHNKLKEKGYDDIRIFHRFDGNCNFETNAYTNPISFYDNEGKMLYQQPMQIAKNKLSNPQGQIKRGKGYIDGNRKLVLEPKDFTRMNYMTLKDIDVVLKSIIFPSKAQHKFDLTKLDYSFLYKYLSQYPRESDYPKYDIKKYEDSYKKYLFYGDYHQKIQNDSVRIYNIVGQSHGYLSDCAYIINENKKIEFFLTVSIYVDNDEIVSDGKYDYKSIGFPFLSALGRAVYKYEHNRKKAFLPDFKDFK